MLRLLRKRSRKVHSTTFDAEIHTRDELMSESNSPSTAGSSGMPQRATAFAPPKDLAASAQARQQLLEIEANIAGIDVSNTLSQEHHRAIDSCVSTIRCVLDGCVADADVDTLRVVATTEGTLHRRAMTSSKPIQATARCWKQHATPRCAFPAHKVAYARAGSPLANWVCCMHTRARHCRVFRNKCVLLLAASVT